jgi:hypothetical protein
LASAIPHRPPPPAVRVTSSSSSSSSSSCLVNRCVAVAKQAVDLPLDNQTREEKQEDFIYLVNSKAKIRKTKTNFSSSSSSSSSSSAASPISFVNRCEAVAKQSRGFTALDKSNTAAKTRGFH